MIYLDNAATSNPKPDSVAESMVYFVNNGCANPGRGAYSLANEAARLIFEARERVQGFFNGGIKSHVVFTANITESLNLVLKGILSAGDEVIVSSMEHNSMMRPLRELEALEVVVKVVPCDPDTGQIDCVDIRAAISPATKLIAINHGSNIIGTVQPIEEIGKICYNEGILFLVDSAQTAGVLPIDMQKANIDFLAFTGHKSLLGPMGIGGLVLSEKAQRNGIKPLKTGGTGSNSEFETQPNLFPDSLESGTPNLPGIAGLNAGIAWLQQLGVDRVRVHEQGLTAYLLERLATIPNVKLFGTRNASEQVGVISFSVEGKDIGELADQLESEYGVCCRAGLHCSPAAHKTMGTFPEGTIRLSLGVFTTKSQLESALEAIRALAQSR